MKWQCWDCSTDDGCELVDLTGGTKEMLAHEPTKCPVTGEVANWERVQMVCQKYKECEKDCETRIPHDYRPDCSDDCKLHEGVKCVRFTLEIPDDPEPENYHGE